MFEPTTQKLSKTDGGCQGFRGILNSFCYFVVLPLAFGLGCLTPSFGFCHSCVATAAAAAPTCAPIWLGRKTRVLGTQNPICPHGRDNSFYQLELGPDMVPHQLRRPIGGIVSHQWSRKRSSCARMVRKAWDGVIRPRYSITMVTVSTEPQLLRGTPTTLEEFMGGWGWRGAAAVATLRLIKLVSWG